MLGLNAFYLAQSGLLAACSFATARTSLIAGGALLAPAFPVAKAFFGSPIVRYAAVFAAWAVVSRPTRGIDFEPIVRWVRSQLAGRTAR